MRTLGILLLGALTMPFAGAYSRQTNNTGIKVRHKDAQNIKFELYVTSSVIQSGYDVKGKLTAAMNEWRLYSDRDANFNRAVTFAPIADSTRMAAANDGINLILVADTAATRALFACPGPKCNSPATTTTSFNAAGDIIDADIIFNPLMKWGGGSDIQKVARHEIGHALGANHSSVVDAAMWPSSSDTLTFDDIMFLWEAYPANGSLNSVVGRFRGTLRYTDMSPVRYGMLTFMNDNSVYGPNGGSRGGVIQTVTDGSGNYDVIVLQGTTAVIAHRADQFVPATNLALPAVVDSFPTCVMGTQCWTPQILTVSGGTTTSLPATFTIPKGTPSSVTVTSIWGRGHFIAAEQSNYGVPIAKYVWAGDGGAGTQLWVRGAGLNNTLTNVEIVPVSTGIGMQSEPAYPLFWDPTMNQGAGFRVPVNVAGNASGWGGLLIRSSAGIAIYPGGIFINPAAATRAGGESDIANAASLTGGSVSAGSLATFTGDGFTAGGEFSAGDAASTTLGGVSVSITDSDQNTKLATLLYAGPKQVNFLLPDSLTPGPAVVLLTKADQSIVPATTVIAPVSPGLFTANSDGSGPAAGFGIKRPSSAEIVSSDVPFGIVRDEAPLGYRSLIPIDLEDPYSDIYLTLFGTGARHYSSISGSTATIGGVSVPVQTIETSTLPGVDQLMIGPLPRTLDRAGEVEIVVTIDGKATNAVLVDIR